MVLYKYKHFDKIQIKVIYSPSNWVTALHDGFLYSKRRRFEYQVTCDTINADFQRFINKRRTLIFKTDQKQHF